MTFNNEHIKQEPCSPSSETISTQHLAGSTMYHHGARAAVPAYIPAPPSYQYYSPMAGQYSSGSDSQAASPSPKAELKKTILSRRKANGQGELGPLFEDEKRYELTQADIERRERRREQNRRAAKKCRNKKKNIQSKVSQETQELIQQNKRLAEENLQLEHYVHYLSSLIDEHMKSGCCNLPKQMPHYEIQRPASAHSAHVDMDISSAISGANLILSSDSIAAKGADSAPVVNSQPAQPGFDQTRNVTVTEPVKNLESFNLSSLDFTNIVSDLTSEMQQVLFQTIVLDGTQQPHFLHSAQQADLTSLGQCVDPNLVQHNVVSGKQLSHAAPADRLSETSHVLSRVVDHCPTTTSHLSVSACQNEYINTLVPQRFPCNMDPNQVTYFACDGYNEQPVEYQYYSSSQN